MGIENKSNADHDKALTIMSEASDPDRIMELILSDIGLLLAAKYKPYLENTDFFNLTRLEFLLGGQFRIAKMAREQGYIIEDCEMCSCFDRELSYCQHYHILLAHEEKRHYYYAALCPALKAD
jgi:hypothetical protein